MEYFLHALNRREPQNVVHRLRRREMGWRQKTSVYNFRKFYTCIMPNLTVQNIEKRNCYVRKFSLDGKYLICFSADQLCLEIYEFLGVSSAMKLIDSCTEELITDLNTDLNNHLRSKIFDHLFRLKHRVEVSGKQLNRECSLFTKDMRYVIVGTAVYIPEDLRPHFYAVYTNNETITPTVRSPLEDYTLHIVDLHQGTVRDSKDFAVDKIILSHNQGLYLCNETLALLSIQHQTIHLFHIVEGTFIPLRSIGRFCCKEEQLLYNTYATNTRAFREITINSLKHRILVFLYKDAVNRVNAGDKNALRRFYQNFDNYRNLRMWKMQLFDDDHLLIKYAHEDVVTLKAPEPNTQPAFFVFYHIWEKKVLGVYSNTSEDLLWLFEHFVDDFRNSLMYPNGNQYSCSFSNNLYANNIHQRFKMTIVSAKGGSKLEATKRLLAQHPISAQSYSSSPYLDLSLFSYDDKYVSAMERPKSCSESPIRFFSRESGSLKFRIYAGNQTRIVPANARRLVAFCFHPNEPFAISVQRINSEYIVNFHIRHPTVVPCNQDGCE